MLKMRKESFGDVTEMSQDYRDVSGKPEHTVS